MFWGVFNGLEEEHLNPGSSSRNYQFAITPQQKGETEVIFIIKGILDQRGIEEVLIDQHAELQGRSIHRRKITIV